MNLVKCPRCDLNYILDTEKYCKVCLREMKGNHVEDELEMCSVCNEAPALPGHDVCLSCLKEMNGHTNDDVEDGNVVDESSLGLNSVSTMDEIIPQMDDDDDFADLEGDLSLESVIEDEENSENEDEEDDE